MTTFASLEGEGRPRHRGLTGYRACDRAELGRAGADVVVGYRTGREEAEAVAAEVGGRAVEADVRPRIGPGLVESAGELDVLVNNAGLTRDGLLVRMTTRTGGR